MMKPTKGDQIVGIGATTLRPWDLVMDLQAVATVAAVCSASTVTMKHKPPKLVGYDTAPTAHSQGPTVPGLDDLETSGTSDLVQDLRADSGPSGHLDTVAIDEDGHDWGGVGGRSGAFAHFCECNCAPVPDPGPRPVG